MPKIIADEEIFRAVMQIVGENGFSGATTKQIAEAAQVSEVTLFRKYESKIQLIKKAVDSVIAQTDFASAAKYSGDVSEDLLRVVQAYQGSAVKHGQFIFIMLSEMSRYPELAELIDSPLIVYSHIRQLLEKYQSEGLLRQEYPMHAMSALLGPLIFDGMMRKVHIHNSIPPLDLAHLVACFLEGRRV